MNVYAFEMNTRDAGAIGIFWPKVFTTEATSEEEARGKVCDLAQSMGYETAGGKLLMVSPSIGD